MNQFNYFFVALSFCVLLCGCQDSNYVELDQQIESNAQIQDVTAPNIYVYITGQVKSPGVYQVMEGTRLYQVVELAGGMTKKADKKVINLAEEVVDGQSIHIPSKFKKVSAVTTSDSSLININTAQKEQLLNLPGIGESKALAIITYRDENGNFSEIEDIKNVSGIGDATFNNLKDLITV